jgi:uncharacterized FlaG/YvyC family protein
MAQNSVLPLQGLQSTAPATTPPPAPTTQERALNRSILAAVQTLNDAGYPGSGREVTFSVDHVTKLPVIKIVDASTQKVIEQWPPEYLLQLAADANKLTRDTG